MPTYYRLVEPAEEGGTPTYEEVTEIEVPEDHPKVKAAQDAAKAAKDEAIKQRQRYKQLRDQLAAEEEDAGEGETPDPKKPKTESAAQSLDIETVYTTIKQRLEAEQTQARTVEQQRDAAIQEALKKHKLPKDLVPVLKEVAVDKLDEVAGTIAKTGLRFDSPAAGGSTSEKPLDLDGLLKKMNLDGDD